MEFKNIWNKIITLQSSTNEINNKNIAKALKEIGNPQYSYETIHIGGTNGKGSTSNFIYSYLKTQFKTGLFVSPCVLFEIEFARVNDTFISKEDFVRIYKTNQKIINKYSFTFFEIKTFITFIWFKEQKVKYAVIEVGMGGKYDATNTINPKACVITNIGDDHSEYLGHSFASKAKAKLGIQKPNTPLFTSEPKLKFFSTYPENIILNENEFNFDHFPKYQVHNYNIAIMLLHYLGFEKNKIVDEIKQTKLLPYRFEKIKNNVYFDAAHNIHGINALVNSLKKNKNYIFIVSVQKRKNYLKMIEILKTQGEVYLANFNFKNKKFSFDAKKISQNTNTNYLENINTLNIDQDKIYIFTGSFYFLNFIHYNIFDTSLH